MANARKFETIKWDWNLLWHIVSNDKCLHVIKRLELPWSHSFEEAEIIANNLLQKKTTFKNVPWEVWLRKVFFWHSLNNNVSCAYPFQGTNNIAMRKKRMGEYHLTWRNIIDILKNNGHFLFEGQEIWKGIHDEDIKVVYERFMSPLDNLSEMSLFFH
jgi:hypothetical protein